ncbi:hypothetical protein RHMOL_Rhmol03G0232300 [Rhododendron molle]|uniref:Uncharacterized protein n=1 Tax=Rhododendron molle TaxID=49168 RepID=A0ACC0PKM8_RHOML|nr:hypothetical protein RHMOL_Rhmol03G0232300 [Rhododendron molle]
MLKCFVFLRFDIQLESPCVVPGSHQNIKDAAWMIGMIGINLKMVPCFSYELFYLNFHCLDHAVRATIVETPSSSVRKEPSPSSRSRHLQQSGTFLFTSSTPNKELEKRTVSPHRFPLLRSGSFARSGSPASRPTTPNSRATTPNSSRPTTPNALVARPRFPSEPRKSASMRIRPEKGKENSKEIELFPSKSKRLLKALLSRRKSKKDEMLYTYLDEY